MAFGRVRLRSSSRSGGAQSSSASVGSAGASASACAAITSRKDNSLGSGVFPLELIRAMFSEDEVTIRARDDEKTTEEQPDIQTDERARRSSATFTSFASSGAGAVVRTGYEHASFSDAGKVEFRLGEPEDLQFGHAVAWLREHREMLVEIAQSAAPQVGAQIPVAA